ncbi:hypothetical protein LP419_17890 [Massilia sp. H-1]|nr:hypothetical protein LP419_17890 [Massilia sp. H-1]
MRSKEDSNAISTDRYDYMRSASQAAALPKDSVVMPDYGSPVLRSPERRPAAGRRLDGQGAAASDPGAGRTAQCSRPRPGSSPYRTDRATMSNLLPYAFARDFGVLARSSDEAEHTVEVWVSGATAPAAIVEVSRRFGRIVLRSMDRAELEAAIASAYAYGGGDASQVADEFDTDLDLTKLLNDVLRPSRTCSSRPTTRP